jgi:hypothetical protein
MNQNRITVKRFPEMIRISAGSGHPVYVIYTGRKEMKQETLKNKGIRIKKNQSVLEAIRDGIPHWIHDTREDPSSVSGVFYLPGCTCSECGFRSGHERPFCPHCKAVMKKF